jgi:Domain of Unknown Function (DUF1080)
MGTLLRVLLLFATPWTSLAASAVATEEPSPPKACIDGTAPGFRPLRGEDFTNVNCHEDTWTWKDGVAHCTGKPVGVIRTKQQFTNFELVAQWRHHTAGGNSGIFVWTSDEALKGIEPGTLPKGGIEVQVLDLGFTKKYEESSGKKGDWFTTHGDVFAVGSAKLKPFEPLSPDGSRSFPRKQLTRGAGEWNHYYVRAINGEIRLWVNGEEVSGGNEADPRTGYLCLESEGAPVEFKNLRVRELP